MSKKPVKFKNQWCNQTQLGKNFGISAIAIGKILAENGLKDLETKEATEKAITEGFATFTPLKDGTKFYMWNKQKCKQIISQEHKQLSGIEYWVNECRISLKELQRLDDEGNDKLAYMLYDYMYDDVPKSIRAKVIEIIEKEMHEERS